MADKEVAEIKDKIDIVDLVGSYVQLKKAGTNFRGLCPFHHEKSGSFMVSPQKQIFHCFGCFPPGQLVKTPFGFHKIEEIPESHYIVSGKGSLKPVIVTHSRDYQGNLVDVKVRKLGGIVSLTEDHNVFIVRPNVPYLKENKVFYRRYKKYLHYFAQYPDKYYKAVEKYTTFAKLPAGQIQQGDFVLFPIDLVVADVKTLDLKDYLEKKYTFGPKTKQIPYIVPVNDDLLKLIGYWVAEGSSHRAYIRFSVGDHEEKFANEIVFLIKKVFGIEAKIYHRSKAGKKTGLEITACHAYLSNIFENLCGKGAANKHIPFIFQQLPLNKQLVLLEALHRGDGHDFIANKSDKLHRNITTISRVLSEQIVDILLRANIFPSLFISKEKFDKKGVHHKQSYRVYWSTEAKSQHDFVYYQRDGSKYWLLPVVETKKYPYQGPVYNLTVQDDHSYVATNFAVANCGEGGDIFEFVKKIENVDFREALKILADKAGIKLAEYKKKDKAVEEKEDLVFRINAFASQYYHKVLFSPVAKLALEYVQGRGLLPATIEKWQIGFAPEDFHSLERALMQKNIRTMDMLEAGVSVKSESGKVFDRFRNRITFPIFNYVGECVGFTARVLPGGSTEQQAKYINSPETRIYNKSKILFGLNFAKLEIRKKDYTIVVEGQMDCIKAHQAGFTNCVATSGTALTQDQLVMLKKLSSNVIFCFDSDEAGEKALRRAVEIALPLGLSVKIMRLVGAKDPDELISDSVEKFKSAIKESLWALEYYILKAKSEFEYQSIEQKKFVKTNILPLVEMFTDRLEQEHYMDKVVTEFGMTKQALLEMVKTKDMPVGEDAVVSKDAEGGQERLILGGIIEIPSFREQVGEELEPNDFSDPKVRAFIELLKVGAEGEEALKNMLAEPFAKEAAFMVELRLQELQQNKEAVAGELLRSFHLLRLNAVKRKLTELVSALKRAEAQKDPISVSKLSQEYQHLIAVRLKLEKMYNL